MPIRCLECNAEVVTLRLEAARREEGPDYAYERPAGFFSEPCGHTAGVVFDFASGTGEPT